MFQNLNGSALIYTLGNRENVLHLYLQYNVCKYNNKTIKQKHD